MAYELLDVTDHVTYDTPNKSFTAVAGNFTTMFSEKVRFTADGGIAVLMTNKTGALSVKGYCLHPHPDHDNAVQLVPVGVPDCIGVFLESNVADGDEVWVVISGIAYVYYITGVTRRHLARTFINTDAGKENGKAMAEAVPTSPFASDKHFCEIGHVLETTAVAGLALTVLHFN